MYVVPITEIANYQHSSKIEHMNCQYQSPLLEIIINGFVPSVHIRRYNYARIHLT